MIKRTFIALFIVLFCISPSLFAQYELEGYIKAAPLHKSTKDIMGTIQKLGLPPEQQVLPYLFLGFLGYPEYPGLSREENVSLFIYSTPDYSKHQYVVLLKLEPSSPLRETFPQLGWSVKEYKDWTLLSQSEDILSNINNPDSLIRVTQRPTESDIEAGYLFKQSRKHIKAFEQKLKEEALDDDPLSHENVVLAIDLVMDILERCHGGSLGLNFNNDSIDLRLAIKANPNTPEAKLLSQKAGLPYTLAKHVKRGNIASFAYSSDPVAEKEYLDFILNEAMNKATPSSLKTLTQIKESMDHTLLDFNGTYVGALSLDNDGKLIETTAYGGKYSDESATRFMRNDLTLLVSSFTEFFVPDSKLNFDVQFEKEVFKHEDIPIHLISIEMNSDELEDIMDDGEIMRPTYFAAIDGSLVSSTDPETIQNLAKAIRSQEPVTGNVFEALPPKENTYFQFEFNLQNLLEVALRKAIKKGDQPDLQAALDSLSSTKFKSIRGFGQMEDRTLTINTNIPLGNIYKIQDAFKKLSPSIETAFDDDEVNEGAYDAIEESLANMYEK